MVLVVECGLLVAGGGVPVKASVVLSLYRIKALAN
jgi:hypothetical protein